MVNVSDRGVDTMEDSNFTSCFARSVVVNSQGRASVEGGAAAAKKGLAKVTQSLGTGEDVRSGLREPPAMDIPNGKSTKNSWNTLNGSPSLSCSSCFTSKDPISSSKITDIPMENIANQCKIHTLQWQLKEAQKSREMYRAVMIQVVTFLEKAQHNLELLGSKINPKQEVSRSRSEHQIAGTIFDNRTSSRGIESVSHTDNYTAFSDFTWRRPKRPAHLQEEAAPEKLAQEAFRLLRTVQSVLNTKEPDLVHVTETGSDSVQSDDYLLVTPEHKPIRTTSFSISPKPVRSRTRESNMAFSRKLSLQLGSESRRTNTCVQNRSVDLIGLNTSEARDKSEFLKDLKSDFSCSTPAEKSAVPKERLQNYLPSALEKVKYNLDKPNSPLLGSLSSGEDESGFSSMNSFQDVGLPMVPECKDQVILNDIKLWEKPSDIVVSHKRWSSTTESNSKRGEKQPLKVLWV